MRITTEKIDAASPLASIRHTIRLLTATSQTGVVAFVYTPGFAFEVVRVQSYCRVKAGAVSANVKVATRTSAAVTFTQATEVDDAVSGTAANNRGSKTDALSLEYTTDGSGALTDGFVVIEIRPQAARK